MIAYLDPGAGSTIAAVIASGAVGAGLAWRLARQSLVAKLRRSSAQQSDTDTACLDSGVGTP